MKKTLLIIALTIGLVQGIWAQTPVNTEAVLKTLISSTGETHVMLGADITLEEPLAIPEGKKVFLDLNGKTLQRNLSEASDLGNVIRVSKGGELIIKDTSGNNDGQITGGRATNGGGICNHGTLTLEGGTIASNYASNAGGGIYNAPSTERGTPATFTMTGGIILGNWGKDAGGIYNYTGSSISITGGAISGNTSNAGGGGVVNYGTANISGGTIHNNHATTRGGGIWNGGTLTVGAATVSGNRADIEGGGIWNQSTLNINDAVNVTGNTKGSGWNSNLFCPSGHFVTITGNLGNAIIGISCERDMGTVTSGLGSYGSLDNFSNDCPESARLLLTGGEVKISQRPDVYYYVKRSWDAENQKVVQTIETAPVSDCFYLESGNGDTNMFYSNSTNKHYLVVRGDYTYGRIIINKDQSLILCDGASLSGDGKHGIIDIDEGCKLNIYGQKEDTGLIKDGAIWVSSNRTLNIHGGTIRAINDKREGAAIGGRRGYFSTDENSLIDTDREKDLVHAGVINIYGGSIEAITTDGNDGMIDASAGIGGSGSGNVSGGSGGFISIYGGTVTARGGSGEKGSSGAGIGGAGTGNGGTIKIYGGTVYAYGGNDAPGIGSGEEGRFFNINGGNITISGGTVFAYGNDVAAGIGAGEDADMGIITITGGTIYAQGGGGEDWANAISTDDNTEGANSLTIGDQMMVGIDGQPVEAGGTLSILDGRIIAMMRNRAVTIQPCTHSGATISIADADSHKVNGCNYCLLNDKQESHTFGSYGECAACGLVSLSDNADNRSNIKHWNGKTKTVALSGRKLWKDDSWNTLCLPFDVNSFSGTPLDGATIMTLNDSEDCNTGFDANTESLNLDFVSAAKIEAGRPYLVKWNTTNPNYIENPLFTSVTIKDNAPADQSATSQDGYVTFVGTYAPISFGEDGDNTVLYLSDGNTLNYPSGTMDFGAQRAYFQLNNGLTAGEPISTDVQGIKAFVLNFGEETGIHTISKSSDSSESSDSWYTIDGIRLGSYPAAHGLYIHRGRKVLIK